MRKWIIILLGVAAIVSCATPQVEKPVVSRRAKLQVRLPAQTGQIGDKLFIESIDQYVGTYQGKNKNGEVTINKVMIKKADLFEGAKYEYTISMDYRADKGPTIGLKNEELVIDEKARALTLSKELECDDPGCWYSFADVSLKLNKKGEPFVELSYTSSVPDPDDADQPTEADGRKLFFKVKK